MLNTIVFCSSSASKTFTTLRKHSKLPTPLNIMPSSMAQAAQALAAQDLAVHALHPLLGVYGKWMASPTPLARDLLAEMLGLNPNHNGAHGTWTVRIEAFGSGTLLVPALTLLEGTTCAQVKNDIATNCEGYSFGSFELMLGHGGNVLNDADIIQQTTEPLVLVRDQFCKQFKLSDFKVGEVEPYSFDFVIDGKTIRVEATGEQIHRAYYSFMLGLNWDIKYEGDKKFFVAMKKNFPTNTFQLQLVMYKFDCGENIERLFVHNKSVDDGDTITDFGNFSTKGTINGVPVVLSLPMTRTRKHRVNNFDYFNCDKWCLGIITIKPSDSEDDHPLHYLFTTKSFGDNFFSEPNFAIVPKL